MKAASDSDLVLKETDDFESMRSLALESGLEEGTYKDFVKAVGVFERGTMVACAGLKVKGGVFSLDCVAVRDGFRGRGLGRKLITSLEDEARRLGASELWAIARAPEFFEKSGFRRTDSGVPGGPSLESCLSCRQYMQTCNPSIVVKSL